MLHLSAAKELTTDRRPLIINFFVVFFFFFIPSATPRLLLSTSTAVGYNFPRLSNDDKHNEAADTPNIKAQQLGSVPKQP